MDVTVSDGDKPKVIMLDRDWKGAKALLWNEAL